MKKCMKILLVEACLLSLVAGCKKKTTTSKTTSKTTTNATTTSDFTNPGDYLNGGTDNPNIPTSDSTKNMIDSIDTDLKKVSINNTDTYDSITTYTGGKITEAGNYLIEGDITSKINVKADGVHLFLKNANINVIDDKAITSDYDLVITVLETNTIKNELGEDVSSENLIKTSKNIYINGSGTLNLESTKAGLKADLGVIISGNTTININSVSHGISADYVYIDNATMNITSSTKDGIHAEIQEYDDLSSDYDTSLIKYSSNNGYIYIKDGNYTINVKDDALQADCFIRIDGGTFDITTNNGVSSNINETTKNNASGKGLYVSGIVYTYLDNDTEKTVSSNEYAIIINGGAIDLNTNSDAIHSSGYFSINGSTTTIKTTDDALHADTIGEITSGNVTVVKSYEGFEAAKVQISGGTLTINSVDDGINGADGTTARPGMVNNNCYIIITGGTIYVNAEGDGVDSNNSILITGGTLYIDGPSIGNNAALDSESGITINGGTVVACGALGMVETPSTASNNYVINYANSTNIASGTTIKLYDSNDNLIIEKTLEKSCQSIILSSDKLTKGTYKLYSDDTLLKEITISSTITLVGTSNSNRPGGPGGQGGPGGMFR